MTNRQYSEAEIEKLMGRLRKSDWKCEFEDDALIDDIELALTAALRQYRHNNSDGLVFAYEMESVKTIANRLHDAIALLVEDLETIDRMPFQSTEETAEFASLALVKHREFMNGQRTHDPRAEYEYDQP